MIRLTDQTLCHMDTKTCDLAVLQEFYHLLFRCGADFVEVDEATAERLGDALDYARTVLHLQVPRDVSLPFARVICHLTDLQVAAPLTHQIRVNDVREINLLGRYAQLPRLRIVGLGDLMLHEFQRSFELIAEKLPRTKIELCPTDDYACAGAILTEWLSMGNKMGVTSLLGLGSCASLEQVLLALRVGRKRHNPGADLAALPRLRELFSVLTGEKVPTHQPVVGTAIFEVESGVHVDGILKNAALYEPFPPETVGMERHIVIGKHSGQSSLRYRLEQLGCMVGEEHLPHLLETVRERSSALQRALTDEELRVLARREATLA